MPYLADKILSSIGVLIAYRLAEQIGKHPSRRDEHKKKIYLLLGKRSSF